MPHVVRRIQPRHVAVGAALGSLMFLAALLAPLGFDPAGLVNVGTDLSDPRAVPPGLTVIREGAGYDGQFAYHLALDPFTTERSAEGLTFDIPAYRQQRLLYPLLGWAVSLGQPVLAPAALAAVNVAALAILAWLAAHFAALHGRLPLWGLTVAAFPPAIFALANDLSEVTLAACLSGAAVSLERRWVLRTVLALSLAVLTHEHGVLLALAVALVTLAAPELRTRAWWLTWLTPMVIFVTWQTYLTLVWGETPMRVSTSILGGGWRDLMPVVRDLYPPQSLGSALQIGSLGYVLLFTAACLLALRTTSAHRALCLGWVFSSALLLQGAVTVSHSEFSFWRVAMTPLTLGSLVIIGSHSWAGLAMLILGAAYGTLTAARLVWGAWLG